MQAKPTVALKIPGRGVITDLTFAKIAEAIIAPLDKASGKREHLHFQDYPCRSFVESIV